MKNEKNGITVKEYLCAKINALEKLTDERFVQSEKALILQSKEVERRLENLNHENARLLEQQRTSVNKELYESHQSRNSIFMIIISVTISAVFFALNHLFK